MPRAGLRCRAAAVYDQHLNTKGMPVFSRHARLGHCVLQVHRMGEATPYEVLEASNAQLTWGAPASTDNRVYAHRNYQNNNNVSICR